MLRLLSGRTHQVHTAVVGWRITGLQAVTVTTDVTFVDLDEATIDWYLSTGEHRDKAGAYGMQGAGRRARRAHRRQPDERDRPAARRNGAICCAAPACRLGESAALALSGAVANAVGRLLRLALALVEC